MSSKSFLYFRDDPSPSELIVEKTSADCLEVFLVPLIRPLLDNTQEEISRYKIRFLLFDKKNKQLTLFPINIGFDDYGYLHTKCSQIKQITLDDWEDSDSEYEASTFLRLDESHLEGEETLQTTAGACESDIGIMGNVAWPNAESDEPDSALRKEFRLALEKLPRYFVNDIGFRLGLRRPYQCIVNIVERLTDCVEIVISGNMETGVRLEKERFFISAHNFDFIREKIETTLNDGNAAAREITETLIRNFLAEQLGWPQSPHRVKQSQITTALIESIFEGNRLLRNRQAAVLEAVSKNAKSIDKRTPVELATLKRDIDLVTLDKLIEKFQKMLSSNHWEKTWQAFLSKNPFILHLSFGCPFLQVGSQASVGGHKITGGGWKVADFLVKNTMTNNLAIVEIKTPQTELLSKTPYRDSVYSPSRKLVGAINQALDQKYHLEREISNIKDNSQDFDIESFSVRCFLIIGTMPRGRDRIKSLELFRGNSKNAEVVTFDELLEKLSTLRDFFASEENEQSQKNPSQKGNKQSQEVPPEDLPF